MEISAVDFDTTVLANPDYRITDEEREILKKIPNTTKVKNHLVRFGYITDAIARSVYGISRLADVIYKLRYKIEPNCYIVTEYVNGKNRFGKSVTYAKYNYEGEFENVEFL